MMYNKRLNLYKISLKVKKIIPNEYFTNILSNYNHYFNTASMCILKPSNNSIIYYLNIYLNDLISIDTFIELSIILSFIKYSTSDNIKMKDTKNNEIIYSLSPLYTSNNKGRISRQYQKIF